MRPHEWTRDPVAPGLCEWRCPGCELHLLEAESQPDVKPGEPGSLYPAEGAILDCDLAVVGGIVEA
jgi:hypothetical protein